MSVNPINPIFGVGTTSSSLSSVPAPSSFQWAIEDISKEDSGRTESGKMEKALIGQVIKIELSWQNVTNAVASQVLKAFNHEYLWVKYLDPMLGAFTTNPLEFYVGNRTSPLYNATNGIWSKISFNIITRSLVQLNSAGSDWEIANNSV